MYTKTYALDWFIFFLNTFCTKIWFNKLLRHFTKDISPVYMPLYLIKKTYKNATRHLAFFFLDSLSFSEIYFKKNIFFLYLIDFALLYNQLNAIL